MKWRWNESSVKLEGEIQEGSSYTKVGHALLVSSLGHPRSIAIKNDVLGESSGSINVR